MRSGSVPREAGVWARALLPEECVSHIINYTAGFRHKAKEDVLNFRHVILHVESIHMFQCSTFCQASLCAEVLSMLGMRWSYSLCSFFSMTLYPVNLH